MIIRPATIQDAGGMSRVITPIIASWGSDRQTDPDFLTTHYINHPDSVACNVADDGSILGFQSLRRAEQGNAYDLPEGWGMIGTYVDLTQSGRGIGRMLFDATLLAAKTAGLTSLDATISKSNTNALAYYDAIGFRTYRHTDTATCKRFDLE